MTVLSGLATFVPQLIDNETYLNAFPFSRWTSPRKNEGATSDRVAITPSWLQGNVGLQSRALALNIDEATGAVAATCTEQEVIARVAKQVLNNTGLVASDIDAVVIISATLDGTMFSNSLRQLWQDVGFKPECIPLHLQLGCGGLASGFAVSEAMSYRFDNVLLIASHFSSHILLKGADRAMADETDKWLGITYSLFGDAVAGLIVSQEHPTAASTVFELTHLENKFAPTERLMWLDEQAGVFHMDAAAVGKIYLPQLGLNLQSLLGKESGILATDGELSPDVGAMVKNQFTALFCHQVNSKILHAACSALDLTEEHLPVNADVVGNTSAPGTLVLLHRYLDAHLELLVGSKLAFSWVGAGLGMQRGNAILTKH